jgi:hypothetical protein
MNTWSTTLPEASRIVHALERRMVQANEDFRVARLRGIDPTPIRRRVARLARAWSEQRRAESV